MPLQSADPPFVDALGGEHHMHTQAASNLAKLHKEGQEFLIGSDQLSKLINNDEQVGHRLHFGVPAPSGLVLANVRQVTRLAEHLLASLLLTEQGGIHPID